MESLNTAIPKIQKTKWSITSNFEVEIQPKGSIGSLVHWDSNVTELLKVSLKNIDIPQHTADLIEKMISGKWHISRNEDEIYVLNATFRDFERGSLYRMFKHYWTYQKFMYMDEAKFGIKVYLRDYGNVNNASVSKSVIFGSDAAYMTSLSQIQLSQENNEILEFSVEFKTNEPYCDNATAPTLEFGSFGSIQTEASSTSGFGSKVNSLVNNTLKVGQSFINKGLNSLQSKLTSWDL